MLKMLTRTLPISLALLSAANAYAQHDHSSHDGHDHDHSAQVIAPEGAFDPLPGDHTLGNADAPATLMVFASVTCGHCADWFENQWPQVKRDLVETGRAKIIFREFPTGPMPISVAGFLLADCGSDDKYFDAIEWQMANQTRIREQMIAGQVQQTHNEVGAAAGLDAEQTRACLTDKAGFDKLNDTVMRSRAAGVKSVPTVAINGKLYGGKDVSAQALSTAIARASIAP